MESLPVSAEARMVRGWRHYRACGFTLPFTEHAGGAVSSQRTEGPRGKGQYILGFQGNLAKFQLGTVGHPDAL